MKSRERNARVKATIFVRVLGALLLAAALVCASAPPTAGQTGGGLIVFEAGGAIYVMDAFGTLTEVVGTKAGVNMQPALSPDASRVAFSGQRDGRFSIFVVNVDGTELRRITDGNEDDSEPAWSPDGTRLAFVRGFDQTGSGVVILACQSPGNILTVSVDERPVEVNLTNGLGGTDPAWSPDGTRIAFASARAGNDNFDIYTMSSVDGSNVLRLTTDETQEADPAWSPDGSWIAYTNGLLAVRTSECGNMPIAGTPTIPPPPPDGEGGTLTVFGGPYIYRMAPDGSQQKRLTVMDCAAEPDWSSDGSRIVFVGGPKLATAQVYHIAADGIGPWVQLTFDSPEAVASGVSKSSPSWSGTTIR